MKTLILILAALPALAQVPTTGSSSGNGGGSGGGQTIPFVVTRTSDTALDATAGTVRVGGTTTCTMPAPTVTVSAGSGTIWLYVSRACVMTAASNVTIASCTNCTAIVGTSYDDTGFPIISWDVTAGVLAATGTSAVNAYDISPFLPGTDISITYSGGIGTINNTAVPVVSWVVPASMSGYTGGSRGDTTEGQYIAVQTGQFVYIPLFINSGSVTEVTIRFWFGFGYASTGAATVSAKLGCVTAGQYYSSATYAGSAATAATNTPATTLPRTAAVTVTATGACSAPDIPTVQLTQDQSNALYFTSATAFKVN